MLEAMLGGGQQDPQSSWQKAAIPPRPATAPLARAGLAGGILEVRAQIPSDKPSRQSVSQGATLYGNPRGCATPAQSISHLFSIIKHFNDNAYLD